MNYQAFVVGGMLLGGISLAIKQNTKYKRYKRRKDLNFEYVSMNQPSDGAERPVFAPIRKMYICYQCDTVFNTDICPNCQEKAVIPLSRLTGIVTETIKKVKEKINIPSEEYSTPELEIPSEKYTITIQVPANGSGESLT